MEQIKIYESLKSTDPLSAQMFFICLHTGLRMNEALGLSLEDFIQGLPDSEALQKILKPYDFKIHGYLSLESQPEIRASPRSENGEVPRKALKGKKKISGKDSRTIPIFDSACFNVLVELWNEQLSLFKQKKFGLDPKNYLLLNGLNRNSYASSLRKAQATLGLKRIFTPHDTRHTYSTWLVEETGGSFELCRLILGHSSLDTTMGYVHMAARIQKQLKTKLQLQRPMAFAPKEPMGQVIDIHRTVNA